MRENSASKLTTNRKLRRKTMGRWLSFKKSEDGAAAVEFALVSIPFFLLFFSIIEQGFFFFANRLIDAGVYEAARELKTRQITSGNTTEGEFRTILCNKTLMKLFECGGLSIDVRQIASFGSPSSPPLKNDGSLDTENFGFLPGGRETINVIRVYYDWPTILNWSRLGSMNYSNEKHGQLANQFRNAGGTNGFRRIVGTAAFQTEP